MGKMIYLDYAASTPCDPRIIESIIPYFSDIYANPSNIKTPMGSLAYTATEIARSQVSNMLNCHPQQIIFTSGATESNNIAILGAIKHQRNISSLEKLHIISSSIEHNSVIEIFKKLNPDNIEVTLIKPSINGMTSLDEIESKIKHNTFLVSFMMANNELGVLNNIMGIVELCKKHNILVHSDATQSFGKYPLDVRTLNVDFLSFSGHKIYAPKGIGALYCNNLSSISPIFFGGSHEFGIRPGTLNVPGIVGIGKACEICFDVQNNEYKTTKYLRDKFECMLLEFDDRITINSADSPRLPNISNISFPIRKGHSIMNSISAIACSSGSACDTADNKFSHVLSEIGISKHKASNTLRFSFGRFSNEEDVIFSVNHIINILQKLALKRY